MWPVIERHLAWEHRLFRRPFGPDQLPLYEAYAAIWASDDLEYEGGGATHTTAYNYYHNAMAARLAKLLGEDATSYEHEAELIRQAMERELWLPDRGWFGEWKDLLGLQSVHPDAALWTFYHTLDSEAATPLEAWQMTRFVDTQIAHIPIRGPGVPQDGCYTLPTTSWMPYTWSLNNVVMAEVQHTALAYWQAGRGDEAFHLFKGSILDSMYLGLCPGNLGMCTAFDAARGETQRDFADAIGITSRALVEGLFGVAPDALAGELRIRPGFPADWDHARLQHPDLTLAFRREGLQETFLIEPRFRKPMALRLQVAALRDRIATLTVNGKSAPWHLIEDSVGVPRVEIQSAAAPRHEVVIIWKGQNLANLSAPVVVARGAKIQAHYRAARLLEVADPQSALSGIAQSEDGFHAEATGTLGHRTVFAKVRQGELTWWSPVEFEIRPAYEIEPAAQDGESLQFRVRSNVVPGEMWTFRLPGLLPGRNPVRVEPKAGVVVDGIVENWRIKASANWETVDLSPVFNDKVTRIFENDYLSPRLPYCSLSIPKQGIGSWCNYRTQFEVDDSGLRAVAERNGGRFVLPQGVPFQIPVGNDAKNVVFASRWDNCPREVTIPLHGDASHAYLLMAGSSNPMQSRFDNGEIVVTYADGSTDRLVLQNPTNWWPIDQDYFIDDFAFRRPEPIPPRVDLKTGVVRILDVADFKGRGGRVDGGAATVLDLPLDHQKDLKSVTVRTLANEVVIGVMAITLAR